MDGKVSFFLKGCCLFILTTQAFAVHNTKRWDGFYAGADIGGVLSDVKMQTIVAPGGTYFNYTQDAPQLDVISHGGSSPGNFSGGFFGGYERQFNHIVVGGEASLNSLYLNHTLTASEIFLSDPNILFATNQILKANWQGTLRLKLGFTQNRWLAYLTSGVATTSIKYTSAYNDDNAQPGSGLPGAYGLGQSSKTKYGWTLGAGGEYAINNDWSLQIKYLYSNFGSIKTGYTIIPTPTLSEFSSAMSGKGELTVQSFLLGLVYRF